MKNSFKNPKKNQKYDFRKKCLKRSKIYENLQKFVLLV